jgi:DNA-binding LacI/PurR family transcriptional regulator
VNIREIASRARVSHSTVSRVINNVPTVEPRLARRVQAVIEQVGYRPNYQAQALARGRSYTVGLIVSELSGGNPFFAEIILYFERAAIAEGYEVLISFADTETNPEDVVVCANRMKERQVEGIAVLTFGMERHLDGSGGPGHVPLVFAGSKLPLRGVRNIRINYLAGMRDAVSHLVDFGHRRIGYLSGQLLWSSMQNRYDALRRAMKFLGVELRREYVAACDHTLEGGAAGMAQLLSLPKPPTAVLCCNDMAAVGALKTLSTRRLEAGRDLSLIGFDDLQICKFTQPALSTIRFSPAELARLAFNALLDDIRGATEKRDYEYQTHFVLRDSTGAPRSSFPARKE